MFPALERCNGLHTRSLSSYHVIKKSLLALARRGARFGSSVYDMNEGEDEDEDEDPDDVRTRVYDHATITTYKRCAIVVSQSTPPPPSL